MPWTIRPAEPGDAAAILGVVRDAFTDETRDALEEIEIVETTWRLDARVVGLELVADDRGVVVGHVLGARADLDGRAVVAVAPLAVSPARHGEGIGSALMTELLRQAERQGWPLVALLGDPRYYERFGFLPSGPLGIVYRPVGEGNPHFQVRPLASYEPSLRGEVRYCWELRRG